MPKIDTKKLGWWTVALLLLWWLISGVAEEFLFSSLANLLRQMSLPVEAAPYVGYALWLMLLAAAIMSITGWGKNILVQPRWPVFYRAKPVSADHWTERKEVEIYVLANASANVEPTATPVDRDPQLSRLRELKDAIARGELDARINGARPNAMSTVALSKFRQYVAATNKPYWIEVLHRWEARQALEPTGQVNLSQQNFRMSLRELHVLAIERGWKLADSVSLEVLGFHKGLRQAGCDGEIRFWGRKQHTFESLTRNEPLLEIDKNYWVENWLDQTALIKHDNQGNVLGLKEDNFVTGTLNLSGANRIADIFVERDQAVRWLETGALAFKDKGQRNAIRKIPKS